jgi:hypothetical protein
MPGGGALALEVPRSGAGVPAKFPPVLPEALELPPSPPLTVPLLVACPPAAEESPPVVVESLLLLAVAGPDDEDAAESADDVPPVLLDSAGPALASASEVTSETDVAGTASSALATAVPRSQKPPAKPTTASPFRTNLAMNIPSSCAHVRTRDV